MNKMTTKTTECVAAIVHLHVCSTKLASTTALTSQSLTQSSKLDWTLTEIRSRVSEDRLEVLVLMQAHRK